MEIATHKWTLAGLVAQRAAEEPDKVFVDVVEGPAETYGETHAAGRRWAGMMVRLGVERLDFVATMMADPRLSLHGWLGINLANASEVPVHTDYRGTYLAHVLNTTGARVIVVDEQFVERLVEIADDLGSVETVVVNGESALPTGTSWRVERLAEQLDGPPAGDDYDQHEDHHVCTVLFTSGTTGASKAVLVTNAHLRASVEGAWPPGDLGPDDCYYSMLPMYHMAAKVAVSSMLQSGGRLALRARFKTSELWSDVRRTGATCTCLMGSMAGFLLDQPVAEADADQSLDKVLLIPLPPQLDEFRERFGLRVRTIYNQTETSTPLRSDDYDTPDYRSCGRPRPGVSCRIVDEHDHEVAPGETGELIIRTDEPWTMMAGYLGMPDKTVEAWRNQWLHTGDAFRIDEQGNYYFLDRIKDAMRRRGENISSVELEASVCAHPAVLECAAVAVPSEFDEDEVKVVVVVQSGHTMEPPELIDFLSEQVPRFMVPRYVEIVDALPRTPTAKIRKVELRDAGVTDRTWDRNAHREPRAASKA